MNVQEEEKNKIDKEKDYKKKVFEERMQLQQEKEEQRKIEEEKEAKKKKIEEQKKRREARQRRDKEAREAREKEDRERREEHEERLRKNREWEEKKEEEEKKAQRLEREKQQQETDITNFIVDYLESKKLYDGENIHDKIESSFQFINDLKEKLAIFWGLELNESFRNIDSNLMPIMEKKGQGFYGRPGGFKALFHLFKPKNNLSEMRKDYNVLRNSEWLLIVRAYGIDNNDDSFKHMIASNILTPYEKEVLTKYKSQEDSGFISDALKTISEYLGEDIKDGEIGNLLDDLKKKLDHASQQYLA